MLEFALKQLREYDEEAQLLLLTHYGSKLFGLDSKDSDTDLKGVFLPSKKSMLLNKELKTLQFSTGFLDSKNTKDDIDLTLVPIQHFFKLLQKNEITSIELFFSMQREDTLLFVDERMKIVQDNYDLFLTNNTYSFQGFVFKEIYNYGNSTKRFKQLSELLDLSNQFKEKNSLNKDDKVNSFFEYLDSLKVYSFRNDPNEVNSLFINQMLLGENISFETFETTIQKNLKRFMKKKSEVNQKDISHAFRICFEGIELLENSKIDFPLKNRDFLRKIKYTPFNEEFNLEDTILELEKLFDKLIELSEKSELPTESNQEKIEELLLRFYD